MRIAYFDCFSGISGDMTLGALVDAGVDPQVIVGAVGRLGLEFELTFETVRRGGFRASYARVVAPEEHAHRHLHHIEAMIDRAELPPRQAELAKRIFTRLGEAEANAHGMDVRKVHFHEVGAVDSIVDIVGAAVGLDLLGVDRFEASPIPPGRGSVMAAHGRMPLPAPGTAELLRGVPLADSPVEMELTTPTGAAIVSTICERFGPLPAMTIDAIGHGAGTREIPGQANIVRLFVGTAAESPDADRVWVLETNLDDLAGELVGYTTTRLLEAGALDAFVTPIYMKKNRPGVMISVLCTEAIASELEAILFRETTTLGVRRYPVSRHKMRRKAAEVMTPLGPIKGKLGWLGDRPPTFSPEYDDCARVASERGVPLREVYRLALEAHAAAGAAPAAASPESRGESQAHDHHHHHDHHHDHDHHHHDHGHPHHED
ncbi:nickel pincer cofactor biosynthesis protein LarC [Tautonia sociabilis]|uniref:Putative nickel insertion protein n=1 Tax=Tautonia sociabilis TaxID=2080755 RepID=A0A432MHV9_9BACT|nr:nickel pincer cofactor biosynthesis protein LarC [Tautonia sociabilis]RUL86943.1 nickel pincer cofactor biosynthesis protein LarC [Tautonia sociabilis]